MKALAQSTNANSNQLSLLFLFEKWVDWFALLVAFALPRRGTAWGLACHSFIHRFLSFFSFHSKKGKSRSPEWKIDCATCLCFLLHSFLPFLFLAAACLPLGGAIGGATAHNQPNERAAKRKESSWIPQRAGGRSQQFNQLHQFQFNHKSKQLFVLNLFDWMDWWLMNLLMEQEWPKAKQ